MNLENRNPFFDIKVEKLFTSSGIEIGRNALVNSETLDVVGLVSENYNVVENEVVAELFNNAIVEYGHKGISDHMDASTKRWKRRIILGDDLKFEVAPGDNINIMIEVFNGYDAKTAYGYNVLGFRWVCTNGVVMGKKKLFSESFSHFDGNVEKLRQSFKLKFDMFQKNNETWQEWNTVGFNRQSFDNFIDSHTKPAEGKVKNYQYLSTGIGKGIKDSYQPLIARQKLRENKWGAFNVLTYISTHETKARKGSNLFSARHNTIDRLAGDFYDY